MIDQLVSPFSEDGAVECEDLAGALGVAEPDFLSGRDLAAPFAGEPLRFLVGLVLGLDCFVDFGFDFLLSPLSSSCTASDISL